MLEHIILLLTVSLLMASFVRRVPAALNKIATSPADKDSVEPRLSKRVSVRSPPCKTGQIQPHVGIHAHHPHMPLLMSPNITAVTLMLFICIHTLQNAILMSDKQTE